MGTNSKLLMALLVCVFRGDSPATFSCHGDWGITNPLLQTLP